MGKKILVVSRDIEVRHVLALRLAGFECAVMTAGTAAEAISAIEQRSPNVLMIDLSFPNRDSHGAGVDWDNFLVISWAGRHKQEQRIPFIALATEGTWQGREQALAAGATDFLHPTVSDLALRTAIDRAIGLGGAPYLPGPGMG